MMKMTQAEKQKRYRDKKRNESVTNSNGNSYGGVIAKTLEMVDAACGDAMGRPLTPENVREQVQAVIDGRDKADVDAAEASLKTDKFTPWSKAKVMLDRPKTGKGSQPLPGDDDYVGVANATATRTQAREDARLSRAQA